MPALFAGAALLGLLLLLARGYSGLKPKGLAKGIRLSGGILLALLTIALVLTGRVGFAFLSAGGAWFLLMGSAPPWQRTNYGARRTGNGEQRFRSEPRSAEMSRSEAHKVLGLADGASDEDVRTAHRRLMLQIHPDKGGTSYLAAKINEAKSVLLGR